MTVFCLPSTVAERLGGRVPDAAEIVLWDGADAPPSRLAEVEFWVPEFAWVFGDTFGQTVGRLPSLRVIQLTSAGFNHVAGKVPPGVVVCNGRGIHGIATSEWALAAILASLRDIPRFVRAADEHRWAYRPTDELAGKRVVIIGAGDLGQHTARRVRAFEAEAVLVGRTAREGVHAVAELADLLPTADVVVLMVPLDADTTRMVDAAFLARLKDGALLVNAARGAVVDTEALVAELTSGRLHAALDVTDPEPLPADHPLWSAPNLLMTPHVGGSVHGFLDRAVALVAAQMARYAAGEPLQNVVIS